jgi:hypothetical protein
LSTNDTNLTNPGRDVATGRDPFVPVRVVRGQRIFVTFGEDFRDA